MRAILDADMRTDALIARFVAHVTGSVRTPEWADRIPVSVRDGPPDAGGYCAWSIRRSDAIDWLPSFERRLRHRLPPSFRSLVARYIFPSFEVAGLQLLGNTGEDVDDELVRKPIRGFDLPAVLLARGYVQFARQDSGACGLVCFATGAKAHNNEHRMMIVDHEHALRFSRVRILDEVAPSFRRFVERILEGAS
jgi:hypothetical protein